MSKLPPRVEAGDTVAIVSPSWGALSRWPHRLARGTAYLESLDLKVKVMPIAMKSDRWVAGTPQERADDLNAAFADPDVQVVMARSAATTRTRQRRCWTSTSSPSIRRLSSATRTTPSFTGPSISAPDWSRSTGPRPFWHWPRTASARASTSLSTPTATFEPR